MYPLLTRLDLGPSNSGMTLYNEMKIYSVRIIYNMIQNATQVEFVEPIDRSAAAAVNTYM